MELAVVPDEAFQPVRRAGSCGSGRARRAPDPPPRARPRRRRRTRGRSAGGAGRARRRARSGATRYPCRGAMVTRCSRCEAQERVAHRRLAHLEAGGELLLAQVRPRRGACRRGILLAELLVDVGRAGAGAERAWVDRLARVIYQVNARQTPQHLTIPQGRSACAASPPWSSQPSQRSPRARPRRRRRSRCGWASSPSTPAPWPPAGGRCRKG